MHLVKEDLLRNVYHRIRISKSSKEEVRSSNMWENLWKDFSQEKQQKEILEILSLHWLWKINQNLRMHQTSIFFMIHLPKMHQLKITKQITLIANRLYFRDQAMSQQKYWTWTKAQLKSTYHNQMNKTIMKKNKRWSNLKHHRI